MHRRKASTIKFPITLDRSIWGNAADRARIDYKRWQALEEGRANPTLRTLVRVAEALETDFWVLMRTPERRRAPK